MPDRFEQTNLELRVFEDFRKRSGLRIIPESVAKRDPPEPDILCKIEGRGSVAFELSALRVQRIAKIISDLIKEDEPDESPFFRFDSRDPIRRVCKKKLNRPYSTPHPIDLILYAVGPLAPEDVIIPSILCAFQNGSSLGPFQNVWYMGRPNEHCRCLLPVPAERRTTMR